MSARSDVWLGMSTEGEWRGPLRALDSELKEGQQAVQGWSGRIRLLLCPWWWFGHKNPKRVIIFPLLIL